MQHQPTDLNQWLTERGIDLGTPAYEKTLARVMEAAGRSEAISDAQLRSIVDEVVSAMEVLDEVAASFK